METSRPPDPEQVADVETSLFNRMLTNAFFGFMKSAIIGAAVGLLLGGLLAASGLLPPLAILGGSVTGTTIVSGALHVGAWFAGLAGSFGAVAGIQSTRDTRRWFLMHEAPELSHEPANEPAKDIQHEPAQPAHDHDRFQKIVAKTVDAPSLRITP